MLTPVLLLLLLAPSTPADAASTPPPFEIRASLDLVQSADGGTITTTTPVILAGTAFECRSGLQPQTERLGTFEVYWTRVYMPHFGEIEPGTITYLAAVSRLDVQAAAVSSCPSVGTTEGFVLVVTTPTEPGTWTLGLGIAATNTDGTSARWDNRQSITVW